MSRKAGHLESMRHRLAEWEREKESNKHGKAHLADRAINLLRTEIELKRQPRRDDEGQKS